MNNNIMSIHSIESFNESESISILKEKLESNHTIKTFFGENDKTPNHDGFLELVDQDLSPRKQFIVQIKKVENLSKEEKGKNKGKYVYKLRTNFLEYVKQKVTESPAIYFVIDIKERRIFWLYLSDEILMNMNFEGQQTIAFAFSEDNILNNISTFTEKLNNIAFQRNKLFINKSETEIEEMQDALDYINQLLDHDLKSIKSTVFPNLWRFGLKCSDNPDISIGIKSKMTQVSSAVALYPQIKGKNDSGIHEYIIEDHNIFNHLAIGSKIDLLDYSKDTLHKIIIFFFENRIPAKYLPDAVLFEIINVFIQKTNKYFGNIQCNELPINNVYNRYVCISAYFQHILKNSLDDANEERLKNDIINRIRNGQIHFVDMTEYLTAFNLSSRFSDYVNNNLDLEICTNIFLYYESDCIYYWNIIKELQNRNITNIPQIWSYNWLDLYYQPKDKRFSIIQELIHKWISFLPSLYAESFNNLFSNNNYMIKDRYVFKIKEDSCIYFPNILHFCKIYKDIAFSILYDDNLIVDRNNTAIKETNLLRTNEGIFIGDFFQSNTPIFYALTCLLYEGVCRGLGFNPERLNIGHKRMVRHLSFL